MFSELRPAEDERKFSVSTLSFNAGRCVSEQQFPDPNIHSVRVIASARRH